MPGLKRKASQRLSRNSVIIVEPVHATHAMNSSQSFWSAPVEYLRKLWTPFTYTKMTYDHDNATTELHIQTSKARDRGETAVKRHRSLGAQSIRSRSAPSNERYGIKGAIDFSGCDTDRTARERTDRYWVPPTDIGLGFLSDGTGAIEDTTSSKRTPLVEVNANHATRRYSDTDHTPLASTPRHVDVPVTNLKQSRRMRLTETYKLSTKEGKLRIAEGREAEIRDESLDNGLRRLLIGGDEPREATRKREERTRLAAERIAREKEEAMRKRKELRLRRQQPLKNLVQPLASQWEDMVADALHTNDVDRVITTSMEGTQLRPKDFHTLLKPKAWLNDEIINTYIEWIVAAANDVARAEAKAYDEPIGTVPKFIAHNSFFYENLKNKGAQSTERLMKRKKAPGKSLLEVDSVFIPICSGSHWTIGVVRPVAKTIEYFDSMGARPEVFFIQMRSWLEHQLKDQYKAEEWAEPRTECASQSNYWDCGVFVCTNAFCVAFGLDTSCYSETHMLQQRRNIAAILINRGFTGEFAWSKAGLIR